MYRKYETFKTRPNPKPYKDNIIPVHGLLKCKTCKTMWNRDVNSATNIYRIAKNAILQKSRPKYLCRDKKEDNDKNDNKKIKCTKEKVKVNKSTKNKKSDGDKISWCMRDSTGNIVQEQFFDSVSLVIEGKDIFNFSYPMIVHLSKGLVPLGYYQYDFEYLVNFYRINYRGVKLLFYNIDSKYYGHKICFQCQTSNTIFHSNDIAKQLVLY